MTDDRVYLGMRVRGRVQTPVFYRGEQHVCLLGPSGSGKSHIIIPTLSTRRTSAVVVDPKGEAASVCLARRQQLGSDVFVFNPFGVMVDRYSDLKSCGFNPLLWIDPAADTAIEETRGIAEAFVIANPASKDPHWDNAACDLFATLILFECAKPAPSLANVRDMLGLPYETPRTAGEEERADPVFERVMPHLDKVGMGGNVVPFDRGRRAEVRTRASASELTPRSIMEVLRRIERSPIPALRAKAQRYMEGGTELRGVLAAARTHTQSLDSPRIRADLSTMRAFDFEVLKKKPTTVFIILPALEMDIEKQGRWLRLIIGCVLRSILSSPPSPTVGRTLLLVDETAALGHFRPLESAVAYLRAYGCTLFTVWQDIPQLKRNYEKGWESIISACGALMAYAPQEMTTAKYLSELLGRQTKEVPSYSQDRETLEWRPSVAPQGFPLFMPQDLLGMEYGEILCRVQGVRPFRTRGVVYTQTPYAEGGRALRDNPYYKGRR